MLSEKHAVFVYERINETYFSFGEYVDLSNTAVSRLVALNLINCGFKVSNDLYGLASTYEEDKNIEENQAIRDYLNHVANELEEFNKQHVLTEVSCIVTNLTHVYVIVEYIPRGHEHE